MYYKLVTATFFQLLSYGDLLLMTAHAQCLNMLDGVYHGALHFITRCGYLVDHCTLFKYTAPSSWNNVQRELKLSEVITLGELKSV